MRPSADSSRRARANSRSLHDEILIDAYPLLNAMHQLVERPHLERHHPARAVLAWPARGARRPGIAHPGERSAHRVQRLQHALAFAQDHQSAHARRARGGGGRAPARASASSGTRGGSSRNAGRARRCGSRVDHAARSAARSSRTWNGPSGSRPRSRAVRRSGGRSSAGVASPRHVSSARHGSPLVRTRNTRRRPSPSYASRSTSAVGDRARSRRVPCARPPISASSARVLRKSTHSARASRPVIPRSRASRSGRPGAHTTDAPRSAAASSLSQRASSSISNDGTHRSGACAKRSASASPSR